MMDLNLTMMMVIMSAIWTVFQWCIWICLLTVVYADLVLDSLVFPLLRRESVKVDCKSRFALQHFKRILQRDQKKCHWRKVGCFTSGTAMSPSSRSAPVSTSSSLSPLSSDRSLTPSSPASDNSLSLSESSCSFALLNASLKEVVELWKVCVLVVVVRLNALRAVDLQWLKQRNKKSCSNYHWF